MTDNKPPGRFGDTPRVPPDQWRQGPIGGGGGSSSSGGCLIALLAALVTAALTVLAVFYGVGQV